MAPHRVILRMYEAVACADLLGILSLQNLRFFVCVLTEMLEFHRRLTGAQVKKDMAIYMSLPR